MAACQDSKWIINFWKLREGQGAPPALIGILVFDLTITSGTITGDVSIGTTTTSVTGTCLPVAKPDGNLMTLQFVWGPRDIFLTGFTHLEGFKRFKGRFIALDHNDVKARGLDMLLTGPPPDDGETGTGTGQQT